MEKILIIFDRYRRKYRTDLGAYPDTAQGRWVLACDICNEYPTINTAAEEKIKKVFIEGNFDQIGDFLTVKGVKIISYPLTTDFFNLIGDSDDD